MTDDDDADVIDLTASNIPEDASDEVIEINLNAAVASKEAADEAIRRLQELYVGLDGISDGDGSRLLHSEELRRHQTETQTLLQKLKDERDAWEMRRDALRDKLETGEE